MQMSNTFQKYYECKVGKAIKEGVVRFMKAYGEDEQCPGLDPLMTKKEMLNFVFNTLGVKGVSRKEVKAWWADYKANEMMNCLSMIASGKVKVSKFDESDKTVH